MIERKKIEKRLNRLHGMSADKLKAMHTASASTLWWARCWNCKRRIEALRSDLEHGHCPHCGVSLETRT